MRFGVGEQTGLFTYSSDFSLQFAGAEFTGEFARTHRFSRFPARQEGEAIYGTASAFSERGSAFFVNGTRWFGRWLLGGELFAINPDYQTTLRTYQDEVAGLGPLGAMANETMYWDLVQDNEDGDAYPDRRSGTLRAFPRDRKGDDRNDVLIGVDEDQDGLPDTNRNFNGLPDYLEPFLLYHVEANGYRYGLDRNNNDEPDAIEDDLDWTIRMISISGVTTCLAARRLPITGLSHWVVMRPARCGRRQKYLHLRNPEVPVAKPVSLEIPLARKPSSQGEGRHSRRTHGS